MIDLLSQSIKTEYLEAITSRSFITTSQFACGDKGTRVPGGMACARLTGYELRDFNRSPISIFNRSAIIDRASLNFAKKLAHES